MSDCQLALADLAAPFEYRAGETFAFVPAVPPEQLGDPEFRLEHGLRFAYVAGAMANGIASVELVEAMSRAGMLGFFGAAGLSIPRVEQSLERLETNLGKLPFGCNLIHSPNEPKLEDELVDLLLRRSIRLVEASAYLDLTPAIVRYRCQGLKRDVDGRVVAPNRVVAKVSRVEVAAKFFSPPPDKILRNLVARGDLTQEQASLAAEIPVADDLTVEADSGGHTDNRPLIALLPTMIALRDRLQKQFGHSRALRVGAAGGISTPAGVAAAFSMGAAFVVTGTINQACIESGSSDIVRSMLAEAGQADVMMAPAADMFEMGVKLQVLKRGTLFAMRAAKLFEIYRKCDSIEDISAPERAKLERDLFRAPLPEIWRQTSEFWNGRDPDQVERAEIEPKHKMALIFRWYLGLSSRWANAGVSERQSDFQVWCGPAMGAFNEWSQGTYLATPANRKVADVAANLLNGAAYLTRVGFLRAQGVIVPSDIARYEPRRALFGDSTK